MTLVADGLGTGFDATPLLAGALSVTNGALADGKLEITVTATGGIAGLRTISQPRVLTASRPRWL